MTVNTSYIPERSKFAVCCKFGPCTITDQRRRSIFRIGGGGGAKCEKWPKKIGALCTQGRNIKLFAHSAPQKLKWCIFSGIFMLNLMVCSAWQYFLNLFLQLHIITFSSCRNYWGGGKIICLPPPPPIFSLGRGGGGGDCPSAPHPQDRRLCHRHVCRKNDDLYYTIPALLGRGTWITSCD